MIGKLIDTSTKTLVEALGVLIASSVVVVGVITLTLHILGLVGIVYDTGTVFTGSPLVTTLGTGLVLLLGCVTLRDKGLTSDILALGLLVLAVWIAATTSILLALVPLSLLTTVGPKSTPRI